MTARSFFLLVFLLGLGACLQAEPQNSIQEETPMEKATFGAGCFWGVEHFFRQVPGVTETAVGYMGGTVKDPTYRQVCQGDTGHAEVVHLQFDPEKVSYEKLLDLFFCAHDPTTMNRQGPDVGEQYRSVIFAHSPSQRTAAEAMLKKLEEEKRFPRPVVTTIEAAAPFYRAEEYHQRYFEKNGIHGGCAIPPPEE